MPRLTTVFSRATDYARLFAEAEITALEFESLLIRDCWYNVTFGAVPTACYAGVEYRLSPTEAPSLPPHGEKR